MHRYNLSVAESSRSTRDCLAVHLRKLLFLDLDGVLHGLNGRTFERLHVLVHWLRLNLDVDIVLSSSTREYGGMTRLLAALPVDLRPRLISQTPVLRRELGARPFKYIRQLEILRWLGDSGEIAIQFAVLDDDATLFESGWPPLVLCDPLLALKAKNLRSLEAKLKVHEGDAVDGSRGFFRRVGTTTAQSEDTGMLDVSMSRLPVASLKTSLRLSEVVTLLRTGELGSTELPASQMDLSDLPPPCSS